MESNNNITNKVSSELLEAIFKVYASGKKVFEENEVDRYSQIDVEAELKVIQVDNHISDLRNKIKDLMINKLDIALITFKNSISDSCDLYDEVISLLSRFNRITKTFQKGLVDYPLYNKEIIMIENTVLYMVNNIENEDLNKSGD